MFGVHGVGGATGTLLRGVFAVAAVSVSPDTPAGLPACSKAIRSQVLIQLYGIVVDAGLVGRRDLRAAQGDRVPGAAARDASSSEIEGLDITQHGEALQ